MIVPVLLIVVFAAGGSPFTAFVWSVVTVAVWVVSLYLWPYGPCLRCGGDGRNRGSKHKRFGQCRRCKGAGKRVRIGARTVHRGRVSLAERAKAKGK